MTDSHVETFHLRTAGADLTTAGLGYVLALTFVAMGTGIAALLQAHLGLREPGLVYLLSVLVTAMVTGLGPSLLAAVASVLAYDFYFTEPYHTFRIDDPQDVLSITVFLIVAIVASHLTARVRNQAAVAQAREARTTALYAFTRELAAVVRLEELLAIVVRHIGEQFHARAIVSLPDEGVLKPRAAYPAGSNLPAAEREATSFAWAEGRSATMAAHNAVGERWVHVSIGTIRGEVAVLSLNFPGPIQFTRENEQLLDAFTQQAGVALERSLLAPGFAALAADSEERAAEPAGEVVARLHALEETLGRMHREVLEMRNAASAAIGNQATGIKES